MKFFSISLIILFNLISCIKCDDICYDGYGCFTTDAPFGNTAARPFSLLPQDPSYIKTRFYLYTLSNKDNAEEISMSDLKNKFNPSVPTKFIIHGFFNNAQMSWMMKMKDALLDIENMNVITVDWSGGSGLPYTQATSNTQIAGVETARLVQAIVERHGVSAKSFHCIGHSLGAHACGYAGKRIHQAIGRISGLDPAGPYFENTPANVRLDVSDADYVDIIHTNGYKLVGDTTSIGMLKPLGHVDFYPNGGKLQPGCGILDGNIMPHCNHMAACSLYTDSIKRICPLQAYPCSDYDNYEKGNCLRCDSKGCNTMGYFSSPNKQLGSLYLDTQSIYADKRCTQKYQVTVTSGDNDDKLANGKFTIYFQTNSQTSSTETLDNGDIVFKSFSVEKFLVSLPNPLNDNQITSAFIYYKRGWNIFTYESKWMFKSVEIFSADHNTTVRLCPIESLFDTSDTIEYTKC